MEKMDLLQIRIQCSLVRERNTVSIDLRSVFSTLEVDKPLNQFKGFQMPDEIRSSALLKDIESGFMNKLNFKSN